MSTVRAEADRTDNRSSCTRTRRLLAITAVICLLSTVASAQSVTPADPAPPSSSGSSDESPPAMPSVLSLITDLPKDVRNMASLETAIILGTATGATLALRAHDASIASQIEGRMESFLRGGRIAGDLSVQVAASLAVFTVGRIAESP